MKKLSNYLEDVDGFIIDLTTKDNVLTELSVVLHSKKDRDDIIKELNIQQIREFIMIYYVTTYYEDYIILKAPHVYQIIFKELYIND